MGLKSTNNMHPIGEEDDDMDETWIGGVSAMSFNCEDEDDWADDGVGEDELSGLKSAMTGLKSSRKYSRASGGIIFRDTDLR